MSVKGKFDFGKSEAGYVKVYVSERGAETLIFSGSCPATFQQAVNGEENFDVEMMIPIQNLKLSDEDRNLVIEYRKQHLKE